MFDERLFRSKVVLAGLTLAKLAASIGINEVTLHKKIKRDGDFSRSEIFRIANILHLTDEDLIAIFFGRQLTGT